MAESFVGSGCWHSVNPRQALSVRVKPLPSAFSHHTDVLCPSPETALLSLGRLQDHAAFSSCSLCDDLPCSGCSAPARGFPLLDKAVIVLLKMRPQHKVINSTFPEK